MHPVRWLLAILLFATACASATQAPMDAGVDLTMGQCDGRALFAACSDQCHMPICIVASATCSATGQWICDCAQTGPCGADMRVSD
jgi:hypothetical protein